MIVTLNNNSTFKGDFMKKKIAICALLGLSMFGLSACGKNNINLNDYLIEQREQLYTASDDLYSVSFSTGTRESDYNFDGVVNEMVPFGVLTLTRNDNLPLSNDSYAYIVTIGEESYSGFLSKNNNDNSYSADLEVNSVGDETINAQISFTGYTFNQNLENTSSNFEVDSASALKVAENELKKDVENLLSDKNVKIEVVMKIMKDYSSEEFKNYYWYVGIVSTNGDTLGILVDANTGEIIAKKV